jgi:hypothetical protein
MEAGENGNGNGIKEKDKNHRRMEALYALLFMWRGREQFLALAELLYTTLSTLRPKQGGDSGPGFESIEQFRARLILPSDSPRRDHWMTCKEMLGAVLHTTPEKDEQALGRQWNGLKAICILLLLFDTRVRNLFFSEHQYHLDWDLAPTSGEDSFRFVHNEYGIRPRFIELIHQLKQDQLEEQDEAWYIEDAVHQAGQFYQQGGLSVFVPSESEEGDVDGDRNGDREREIDEEIYAMDIDA